MFLSIPSSSISEAATSPLQCSVIRSGYPTNQTTISLSVSETGRISFPANVIIPSDQSSANFQISAIDNFIQEWNKQLSIVATASNYNQTSAILTVLDDEAIYLNLNISQNEAEEGNSVQVTVTRDLVTNSPLLVNLVPGVSSQVTIPSSVTINQNESAVSFSMGIVDDDVQELTQQFKLAAYATGFLPGIDSIDIIDNDVPKVSLTITPDTLSEGGGPFAAWGRFSRVSPGEEAIKLVMTAQPAGIVYFPSEVTIPVNAMEQQFNIGVVDNTLLDGFRHVTITAKVYLASCSCTASPVPGSGGGDADTITIMDNDGPSSLLIHLQCLKASMMQVCCTSVEIPREALNYR
jgi:hypothetical protein